MNQPVSQELREFHQFVATMVSQNGNDLSPEEVLDEWRELHPENGGMDDPAEVARAVLLALADMKAGDKGRAAHEILTDLRSRIPARSE